ncbi:hypothetical protein ACFLTG_02965 [Chloroflexota bacterium]
MAKLGSIELVASQDVKKGGEIALTDLFPWSDRSKEFALSGDVTRDTTEIKVTIAKVGSFNSKADISKKKPEKTNYPALLKSVDTLKKYKTSADINKGDKLSMTLETI